MRFLCERLEIGVSYSQASCGCCVRPDACRPALRAPRVSYHTLWHRVRERNAIPSISGSEVAPFSCICTCASNVLAWLYPNAVSHEFVV